MKSIHTPALKGLNSKVASKKSFSTKLSAAVLALCLSTAGNAQAVLSFTFDYSGNDAGIGFLDASEGMARQAALVEAGNRFSTLFGSHFSDSAVINLSVTSSNDAMGTTLASAGSNFVPAAGTFGGGEVLRTKLQTGIDLNTTGFDGFVDVNWGHVWQLDADTPAGAAEYDLYAALYHEFTHALGIGSEIFGTPGGDRYDNGDQGSGNQGSWAKWDEFLIEDLGDPLINTTTFEVNTAALESARNIGGYFTGTFARLANGGEDVHLVIDDDQSHLNSIDFAGMMMVPTRDFGDGEARTWSGIEVGMLQDLGYTPVPEPSTTALLGLVGSFALIRRRR
ncbi:MAG: PEP-CTERM sorting domain-containing protein [Akkermansiaceae bacterium]